jgi:uncharacterized protein YecE (DUF72 family)
VATAYIGTSGWNYSGWKTGFYAGVAQRNWLRFCAERFTGIEVNGTFYRLQRRSTFERWRDETPVHFRFAAKANRYLTHNKKLNEPEQPIQRERELATGLGEKLAVVVWQLPRNFKKHTDRLERFADALGQWPEARHAVEFRHASWFDEEIAACLRAHRVAVCLSDAADWPMWEAVTTDLVYVRLHGHTRTYASPYSETLLEHWAGRAYQWLQEGRDVHVYFDNDAEGAAPWDALRLLVRVKALLAS